MLAIVANGFLSVTPAEACGPDFPNRMLVDGDDAVLVPPIADFLFELRRIQPPGKAVFAAVAPEDYDGPAQTADADLADLRAACDELKMSNEQREALVARYQPVRDKLRLHAGAAGRYKREFVDWQQGFVQSLPIEPQLGEAEVPDGLPGEFSDYLHGAVAYHRKRYGIARETWTSLLARPAEERRFRSTWAAYMIGRSYVEDQPESAAPWFEKTRTLDKEGFRDSLGLAAASLGWQAHAELRMKHYEQAISLYLEQARCGDHGAYASLRMTAAKMLREDRAVIERVVRHPQAQQVITAYIVSGGGPRYAESHPAGDEFVKTWLRAAEQADTKEMPGVERLAWAAYQYGDNESAGRWLQRSQQGLPIAKWLEAKLLLYDGKIEPAARLLTEVVQSFPSQEVWKDTPAASPPYYGAVYPQQVAWGEKGVLHMARHQYVEAMDALLRGRYWMDAAYVAEQVLTIDELKSYVDARSSGEPASMPASQPDDEYHFANPGPHGPGPAMRYLLARRMAREERWQEARHYYPEAMRPVFDDYVKACKAGHDSKVAKAERARLLMQAARIARHKGMELLGTELDPDWYTLEGEFTIKPASEVRTNPGHAEIVPSTPDERKRLARNTRPDKRWHYRYVAADLAWEAAKLMPDESEETARALCEAGSWLKARDAKAADRFYKALVRRCGSTELGKKAARLKWFPAMQGDEPAETQTAEEGGVSSVGANRGYGIRTPASNEA